MLLQNKVAIVTGAGSGIGKAIALAYAKERANVVVSDIGENSRERAAASTKEEGGNAIFVIAGVASAEDNQRLVQEAVNACGRLDIACTTAGIAGAAAPTGEYDIDGWHRTLAINLNGV